MDRIKEEFRSDTSDITIRENSEIIMGILSSIGGREEQQDNAGFLLEESGAIIAVCDGMGGHNCGSLAADTGIRTILEECSVSSPSDYDCGMLCEALIRADREVAGLIDKNGRPLYSGSTAVIVSVKQGELFWASCGDSRLYICREGSFVQATTDHTYKWLISESPESSEAKERGFPEDNGKEEALISFLGTGGLPYISYNEKAFSLQKGDRLLITTDGLYKSLDEQEIFETVSGLPDACTVLKDLESKAEKHAECDSAERDNTTAVVVIIK